MAQRKEALSRERIVAAAVDVLDASGESGLTFKVLTERLQTGAGAIYWHVANKGELLAAAADAVVTEALSAKPAGSPAENLRAVAWSLHETIDQHPWLAAQLPAQLSRDAGGALSARIYESIGGQVRALGVPQERWFVATSVLLHYIFGAAAQNAVNSATGRSLGPGMSRSRFLDEVADSWQRLDATEHPFARTVADQLRDHDDRAQFLGGIDLILAGILGS